MLAFRKSYRHVRLAATYDRMTGALNRQAFCARAGAMLDLAQRQQRIVLLSYLDLDGFKAGTTSMVITPVVKFFRSFRQAPPGNCVGRTASAVSAATNLR
ncbi:GGDEF domain-containing protein [Rhizobium lusitanum]|uniref:GGDEF domain-containing protein n=1 Tax=Rhizobium lusitanum TaxID=293958 RepID=UPI001FEE7B68|nr:GGDEF domain-containing protein [Rhizobium lusitanum]